MAISYLMDSNVLIDFTSRTFSGSIERILDSIFDAGFYFSIISKMKCWGSSSKETLTKLDEFLSLGIMHPSSEEIADACILIRKNNPKIKVPDTIIAATAIVHRHTLLTSNINDFKIERLSILDPKDLSGKLSDND